MKPKTLLQWHYRFCFESDWRVGGTGQQLEADMGFLTDFRGRPYLPGSTLKGKIRDSFHRLVSLRPEWKKHREFLFGNQGAFAGQVYFQDGVMKDDYEGSEAASIRNRVAMDRYRKTVKDSAVLNEKIVKAHIPFSGSLEAFVGGEADKQEIGLILLLCLLDIRSIGSGASIGRGKVTMKYGQPDVEALQGASFCWLVEKTAGQQKVWSKQEVEELLTRVQREDGGYGSL